MGSAYLQSYGYRSSDYLGLEGVSLPRGLKSYPNNLIKRILIIEDDADIAEGIKFSVESSSRSHCDIVADSYEAALALSDRNYDFVFVDQKLPGIRGTSVLEEVDHMIDVDPLIQDTDRFVNSVPALLMSGEDIRIDDTYALKNFKIVGKVRKKDLGQFLSVQFLL